MKTMTAAELAEKINGQLRGNPNAVCHHANALKDAAEDGVSFLGNKKYAHQLAETKASIVLIDAETTEQPREGQAYIVCADPTKAFSVAVEFFAPPPVDYPAGIHPTACVESTASVDPSAHIGPFCYVGAGARIGAGTILVAHIFVGEQAQIGEKCLIYPNVTIRERCILGHRVIIHPSAVIGSDGFGFAPGANGIEKIPQVGIVKIDDDVEIGACTTVDRARFGQTHIKQSVKIDNLCQIAHNVTIGAYSLIVAQVGIAGSTELEQGVIMGGKSSCAGHLVIGAGTKVAGTSALAKSCPPQSMMFGTPALPQREWLKNYMTPSKVEKLEVRVKTLEDELKNRTGGAK